MSWRECARFLFFAGMWGWACRRLQHIPLIPAQAGIQQQISAYEIVAVDPRFCGDEREGVCPDFVFCGDGRERACPDSVFRGDERAGKLVGWVKSPPKRGGAKAETNPPAGL